MCGEDCNSCKNANYEEWATCNGLEKEAQEATGTYELVQFPQVDLTKEEERQWLDKAFAPLLNFLTHEMSSAKDEIISTVMYMG